MRTLNIINNKQNGMALLMALIFLLVLTVLGITVTSSTILSEKMSQNMRDMTSAFEAAESALGDGESWANNLNTIPTAVSTCSSAPCSVWQLNVLSTPSAQPMSWWQSNGRAYSTTIPGLASQPRYIVELFSFVPYDLSPNSLASGRGYYYYRITAKGVGTTNSAVASVQSIYATQFN